MNKHYSRYLINKYVPLYQKRNDHTPHPFDFSFRVGDGWFNIVNTLSHYLCERWIRASSVYLKVVGKQGIGYLDAIHGSSNTIKDSRFNYIITDEIIETRRELLEYSIKETPIAISVTQKYGGLQFYAHGTNTEQTNAIQFANSLSNRICEVCGQPGKLGHTKGLLATRCGLHRKVGE